jgi:hypothetical protein
LQLHGHCQELALELLREATVAEYLVVRLALGAQHAALLVCPTWAKTCDLKGGHRRE